MSIGDRIKEARLAKGMTQEELGKALGSTKQLISKYEKDIVGDIPLSRVEQLAAALGVSEAYLLGWPEKKKIPAAAESGSEDELQEVLEEMRERPELRVLFHSTKNASAEQIKQVAALLQSFKNPYED